MTEAGVNPDEPDLPRVKTFSSTVRSTAVAQELRYQRNIMMVLAVAIVALMIGFVCAIILPEILPKGNTTTRKAVIKVIIPTEKSVSIDEEAVAYQDAGYQCADRYAGENEVEAVGYCKHFGMPGGLWYAFKTRPVRFGKYFLDDNKCYIIGETETQATTSKDLLRLKGEYIEYLELQGDYKFVHSKKLSHANCTTIEFKNPKHLHIEKEDGHVMEIREFVIARAQVYSKECQTNLLIPALYSAKVDRCFFGNGVGKNIRYTDNCHVLCDEGGLSQLPEWTIDNP